MKTILKQLLYMNLTLLLVVLLVLPAAAETLVEYTLTLHGSDGATHQETDVAGTAYALADYLFQRDSHVQVAWSTEEDGGKLHRLNALYVPATSTDLYAFWVEAGAGEIILNGLSGDLDEDGTFYQKYSGPVTLPDELVYKNNGDELLAWSTEVNCTPNDQGIFSGQWFSGGTDIQPQEGNVLELYGHAKGDGAYVIYHPTDGTIVQGGNILVQRAAEGDSGWAAAVIGADYFVAPEGCTLAGWAVEAMSERADYEAQESLILQDGECVHLYALWEKECIEHTPENGVRIVVTPKENTVVVTLSSEWCKEAGAENAICGLYTAEGKLLICGSGSVRADGAIQIDLKHRKWEGSTCKIFTVDKNWCPVRKEISWMINA